MRRIAIERKSDCLVLFRIRSPSSLSLVFATGIRRRNRDEGRINESGRARVEADKFGRENGRLRWIDSTVTRIGRTSRRSPTREMVEITSRSIDWGSRKGRNG